MSKLFFYQKFIGKNMDEKEIFFFFNDIESHQKSQIHESPLQFETKTFGFTTHHDASLDH